LLQDARDLATKIRDFTRDRYRADADRLCAAFSHLSGHGVGNGDFLSFGAFPDNDGELMLPRGLVTRDGEQREVDATAITESVASSRFEPSAPLHPQEGETQPLLNRQDAYTWIKAPRLDGRPCEVGPLARAVVAGTYDGPKDLLARHLARAEEALTLADKLQDWIDGLVVGETGCPALLEIPTRAEGAGLTEAPRGALGHWISIDSRTVQHYQVISPTTWNGSPRDESGAPGPMETGLVGQKVADLDDPIEALRVVHSFDPCVQCAVH
jgi:hydrogenase large subunit